MKNNFFNTHFLESLDIDYCIIKKLLIAIWMWWRKIILIYFSASKCLSCNVEFARLDVLKIHNDIVCQRSGLVGLAITNEEETCTRIETFQTPTRPKRAALPNRIAKNWQNSKEKKKGIKAALKKPTPKKKPKKWEDLCFRYCFYAIIVKVNLLHLT